VSLVVGKFWGKYQIVSEIGHGGTGVVYLAVDPTLDRNVALKLLALDGFEGSTEHDRIQKEAKIAATFTHPNIVHIHSFDNVDGQPFIEMEYVPGGSLATRLRERVVTVYETLGYVNEMCKALAYCHSRGGIHRDVKPENILIDADGTAKLADFGLSKMFSESAEFSSGSTVTGIFKGTPNYAAPEAWDGEKPTSAWDTYSLGVVLHRCLTGELPYPGNSPLEIARNMAAGPCKSLKSIAPRYSSELSSLLESMLRTDPALRLSDATEISRLIEMTPEWIQVDKMNVSATLEGPNPFSPTPFEIGTTLKTHGTSTRRKLVFLALIVSALFTGVFSYVGTEASLPLDGRYLEMMNLGTESGTVRVDSSFTITFESQAEIPTETWSFRSDSEADEIELFGVGDTSFSSARLVPLPNDRYEIIGGWARILDAKATGIRTGTIKGIVNANWDSGMFAGVLHYNTDQDGRAFSVAVMGEQLPQRENPFSTLEKSDFLFPILYRELVPRNLNWAANFESNFPGNGSGRYGVSQFQSDDRTAVVDGVLNETNWTNVHRMVPDGTLLNASEGNGNSSYFQMFVENGFIHYTVVIPDVIDCGTTPQLMLNIMPTYSVPLGESPHLRLGAGGEGASALNMIVPGEDPVVMSESECVVNMTAGRWIAEGHISLEALNNSGIRFGSVSQWRCVLKVTCGEMNDVNGIERWGFGFEDASIRHGFVLEMPEGIF